MSLLDSLPELPDITGRSAYPTRNSGVMHNASVGGIPNPDVVYNKDGSLKADGNKDGLTMQKIVMIVLGLLFIAAGVFSFREVRQTVVSATKTAGKAAAAA